jgi:catechol 2,3-dioxygenase-like lactoylglutathione lyase family enzyme
MNPSALSWLGLRTADLAASQAWFTQVLGLHCSLETEDFVVLQTENGDVVELFRAEDPAHSHFTSGPVPGLQVDDLDAALQQLETAGVSVLGPIGHGSRGTRWVHFLGPDGYVFELIERGATPAQVLP